MKRDGHLSGEIHGKEKGASASFRSLFEQLSTAVTVEIGGQFIYANPAFLRLLGCDIHSGISPAVLIEQTTLGWKRLVAGKSPEPNQSNKFEGVGIKIDGSSFSYQAEVASVNFADGTGTVLLITDMTEETQMEAEMKQLAAFTQRNPNPILELTSDGKLIYFNEAARAMSESVGKKFPVEVLPIDTQTTVEDCLATGRTGHRYETHADGRTIAWSFVPILERRTVHCYARVVTEQRFGRGVPEGGLDDGGVAQWAGGIAHELNNILTLIQSNASFLLMEKKLDAESVESTQQIYSAVGRAACLTEKLFAVGKKE